MTYDDPVVAMYVEANKLWLVVDPEADDDVAPNEADVAGLLEKQIGRTVATTATGIAVQLSLWSIGAICEGAGFRIIEGLRRLAKGEDDAVFDQIAKEASWGFCDCAQPCEADPPEIGSARLSGLAGDANR